MRDEESGNWQLKDMRTDEEVDFESDYDDAETLLFNAYRALLRNQESRE